MRCWMNCDASLPREVEWTMNTDTDASHTSTTPIRTSSVHSDDLMEALCEAQACLKDAMRLIREIAIFKDVDIDHDEVWIRWKKAVNSGGSKAAVASRGEAGCSAMNAVGGGPCQKER